MISLFILTAHLLFAGLTSFELLNFAGVLKYELHFSWLALALITVISWLVWLLTYRPLKKQKQNFLAGQVGVLSLSAVYADFLGNLYHFYSRFSWYDQLTHFLGGLALGSVAFALLWYLKTQQRLTISFLWIVIFSLCLALSAGVFYEFEEYLEDYYTDSKKLGDSFDTADDLAWDFLGALAMVVPLGILMRGRKKIKEALSSKASQDLTIY